MKIKSFLLALIFGLTPAMWTQDKPAQAPPGPGSGNQMRAEHHQEMMEMHKQRDGGHESRHREDEILARSDEG